jgi:hypothetical protein
VTSESAAAPADATTAWQVRCNNTMWECPAKMWMGLPWLYLALDLLQMIANC